MKKRKIECLENSAMSKTGFYLVNVGKGNRPFSFAFWRDTRAPVVVRANRPEMFLFFRSNKHGRVIGYINIPMGFGCFLHVIVGIGGDIRLRARVKSIRV